MAGKNLYHSALASPTTLTVKSGVIASKFPGKSPYVIVGVNGVDMFYACENPQCGLDLAAWNGHECRVTAQGREASATLQIEAADQIPGAEHPALPPSQQQHPPPAPQRTAPPPARGPAWGRPATPAAAAPPSQLPPPLDPAQQLKKAYAAVGSLRTLMEMCKQAATHNAYNYAIANKDAIKNGELPVMDGDTLQHEANAIFYACERAGVWKDLPDQLPPQ